MDMRGLYYVKEKGKGEEKKGPFRKGAGNYAEEAGKGREANV